MWGFLCRMSVLTISCSQDVGLANAPCRMVGGCLTTIQHQETIHMNVNKVYAVLAKKSISIIVALSTIILILGFTALILGGSVELNANTTTINIRVIGK